MSFWKKRPQTKTAYGAVKKEVWRNLLLLPGPFLWLSRTDTCCSSITLSNLAFPTTWRENYCNLIGEESKAGNYLRFARLVSGQTKIRRQVCVFAPAPLIFCWHTLLPERGVNFNHKGLQGWEEQLVWLPEVLRAGCWWGESSEARTRWSLKQIEVHGCLQSRWASIPLYLHTSALAHISTTDLPDLGCDELTTLGIYLWTT